MTRSDFGNDCSTATSAVGMIPVFAAALPMKSSQWTSYERPHLFPNGW